MLELIVSRVLPGDRMIQGIDTGFKDTASVISSRHIVSSNPASVSFKGDWALG